MANGPIGSKSGELAEFDDGGRRIRVYQSGAKILANIESLGVEALGLAVFADSRDKIAFVAKSDAKVVMRVGVGVKSQGLFVLFSGTVKVVEFVEHAAQACISARVVGFAADRGL